MNEYQLYMSWRTKELGKEPQYQTQQGHRLAMKLAASEWSDFKKGKSCAAMEQFNSIKESLKTKEVIKTPTEKERKKEAEKKKIVKKPKPIETEEIRETKETEVEQKPQKKEVETVLERPSDERPQHKDKRGSIGFVIFLIIAGVIMLLIYLFAKKKPIEKPQVEQQQSDIQVEEPHSVGDTMGSIGQTSMSVDEARAKGMIP